MRTKADIEKNNHLNIEIHLPAGGVGIVRMKEWLGSVVWVRDECGLEHVSVSPYNSGITPSWDDMCMLKDIFFEDEELVVQIHPPKSHYVNIQPNCLHLWRDKSGKFEEYLNTKRGDGT